MTTKSNDLLASLGILLSQGNLINSSPEEMIIEILKDSDFPSDKKVINLLYSWLYTHGKYVYFERLKTLSKNLESRELSILKSLCSKLSDRDYRWGNLAKKINIENTHSLLVSDDKNLLRVKGVDKSFEENGILIADVLRVDTKKVAPEKSILIKNRWFFNRLKYGVGLKADIVTLQELNLVKNAYQSAKILGCSKNAAYRQWNEIELIKSITN